VGVTAPVHWLSQSLGQISGCPIVRRRRSRIEHLDQVDVLADDAYIAVVVVWMWEQQQAALPSDFTNHFTPHSRSNLGMDKRRDDVAVAGSILGGKRRLNIQSTSPDKLLKQLGAANRLVVGEKNEIKPFLLTEARDSIR